MRFLSDVCPTSRLQATPGSCLCWQSATLGPACLSGTLVRHILQAGGAVTTLLLAVYVASFLIVKKWTVDSYENSGIGNVHPIRSWYNKVFYPLRWLNANGWIPLKPPVETEHGVLRSLDARNITLDQPEDDAILSIGFPLDPKIVEAAQGISVGDHVVVWLGSQLENHHDRFVNRFVEIRKINQETEPDGAANRSQPIRAEPNRTSVAAGSDR